jgi:hypothetical protein
MQDVPLGQVMKLCHNVIEYSGYYTIVARVRWFASQMEVNPLERGQLGLSKDGINILPPS